MGQPLTRRDFLLGMPVLAATPALTACGSPEPERPPGVPIGPFGAKSTAEEVTAGVDLTGKTALVTGANSGLGYETMRVLALRGAHVIGTARTIDRAREACNSVQGQTTPLALELTDFDSIVACAQAVQRLGPVLDILICNAGVMEIPTLEQVRGIEKHFVTNHLGHFLLTNRLLPQIIGASRGRVVVVSSGAAYRNAPASGIEFDNLSGERDYEPGKAYGQSKLANVLFARELARRLQATPATANSLQPGVIMTNLGRYLPWWQLANRAIVRLDVYEKRRGRRGNAGLCRHEPGTGRRHRPVLPRLQPDHSGRPSAGRRNGIATLGRFRGTDGALARVKARVRRRTSPRCRPSRSSRRDSWPGTAGDSPRRSRTPAPAAPRS